MKASTVEPDLILFNARAITLEPDRPTAEAVAVKGDRITWVGSNADLGPFATRDSNLIDCRGMTLVPGFIDAHCHLMAYAASLLAVDCSPRSVRSIADLQDVLREATHGKPADRWIKGSGYDEFAVAEKRFPTRQELDEAAPSHPVKLDHRSGHACVLSSKALCLAGVSNETPDPIDGVIDRDWDTGEPTGLLLEMNDYVDGAVPPLSPGELSIGVEMASKRLVALGVTSVQDATSANSPERWEALQRLQAGGAIAPRVTMMAGARHLDEFLDEGMRFRHGDDCLNLGAVKVMLTATTGALQPSREELGDFVLKAHRDGFQVAVHAVESEAVEAAAEALLRTRSEAAGPGRDRIEHCSECPPSVLRMLAHSGIIVVTQPGFVYHSGYRYLSEVPEDIQPWLYRIGSFLQAGLRPAAGSDAPVAEPSPVTGMYAATTRRSASGQEVGPTEAIPAHEALRMYTASAAYAAFQEADKGSIAAGKLADLVLLDGDPTTEDVERILGMRPVLTMIGGRVVWERLAAAGQAG